MHQRRVDGRRLTGDSPLESLLEALGIADYGEPEPVIEWPGTDRLAALDVDFHARELARRPDNRQLDSLALLVRPRPALHWITHGRGLRCIYVQADGYDAEDLASVAALSIVGLDPTATIEIKSETRHPRYPRPDYPAAGAVQVNDQLLNLGELKRLLGSTVSDDEVAAWLAEHGLTVGSKYPHDRCPIDPSTVSHGDPVFVGDEGIFCHKCDASGLSIGSAPPGFAPYSALIAGGLDSKVLSAVRHFVHWEQAKVILAEARELPEKMLKQIFRAALKLHHGPDDPRIDEVFERGRGLVRMPGYWATPDLARPHAKEGLSKRLSFLPALRDVGVDKNGKMQLRLLEEKHGIFQGIGDLRDYGYYAVVPIRGMRVGSHWTQIKNDRQVSKVVLPDYLRDESMVGFRPKYAPLANRMSESEAFARLEDAVPGINHQYLKLLIAARGYSELGIGPPALIVVSGPSGAAKSTTCLVASMLLGDRVCGIPLLKDSVEFHRSIHAASRIASFVQIDEYSKQSTVHRSGVVEQLTPLLHYTLQSTVRLLNIGWVPVDVVPVIIATDIAIPDELRRDRQLGRRMYHVPLDHTVDWQQSARNIDQWRGRSRENADAANAIVSWVIDEFFAGPEPPTFREIAASLGYRELYDVADPDFDPRRDILSLFQICRDSSLPDVCDQTFRGRGWKTADRNSDDAISRAWRLVCDDFSEGFGTSRRLKEICLANIVNASRPIEIDLKPHGSKVGIRFRQGAARSNGMRVNGEITFALNLNALIRGDLSTAAEPTGNNGSQPTEELL